MVTETERKTDKWFKGRLEVKQGDEGVVEAVVSVFNALDSDNDVVLPGAFKDGEELPMVWSHDWKNPIGKGVMAVDAKRAVFKGQFFMDTFDGEQAFRKVKNMGNLQEWSWGFRIKGWRIGDFDDDDGTHDDVRFIEDTERFEVSPVLVGANRETETLAIKQSGERAIGVPPFIPPSDIEVAIANAKAYLVYLNQLQEASHDPSDGKQSGDWSKVADAQLFEATRAEAERAGAKP